MNDELLKIVISGSTSHPILQRMNMARAINLAHGAPVIAAWDVDALPDDWIEALSAVTLHLPKMQEGRAKVEKHFADWRAAFEARKH